MDVKKTAPFDRNCNIQDAKKEGSLPAKTPRVKNPYEKQKKTI